MSSNESYQLLLEIKADVSKAVSGLSQVTDKLDKTTSKMGGLQQATSIAAGVLMRDMVNGLTSTISESLRAGAQIETLANSFESLSKAAGGQVDSLEELRSATKGTVADVDLLRSANQAILLGLPTEGFAELAGAAITLGHAMGIDAQYAVDSLTKGIGRQSKLILDNLGVVFDATEAYEWYAAKMGTTVSALDESTKKHAWMQYAIEQVTEKAKAMGDVTSETQLSQERWDATLKNLTTSLGGMLAPLAGFAPIVEMLLPSFSILAASVLPGLITSLFSYVSTMGIVASAQLGLATVTAGLAGAFWTAAGAITGAIHTVTAAMATNPILLAIMAIIAAVVALYVAWENNWFGIRDIIADVVQWILENFGWLIEGLTNLWDTLNAVWDGISGFFGGIWDAISGAMEGSAEAVEQGAGRMVSGFETLQDSLPIVGDVMEGIKDFVLEMTGTTEEYYEMWAAHQLQIINDTMEAQLAAIDEGLAATLETINNNLEQAKADRTTAFNDEIAQWTEHYLSLLQEPVLEGFAKVLDTYTKHYDDLLAETKDGMEQEIDEIRKAHETEYNETTKAYDDLIRETQSFYNNLVAEARAGLDAIRDARRADLNDLELTYLLEKQALDAALSSQAITEQEFQDQMTALDEQYRDERSQINDDYRIQELQAEKKFNAEEEELKLQEKNKINDIEIDKWEALRTINGSERRALEEASARHSELLTNIENDKKAAIKNIREKEKEITERYSQDIKAIEEKHSKEAAAAVKKANEEKELWNRWAYAEIERVTLEKQNKIKSTTDSWIGSLGRSIQGGLNSIHSAFSGLWNSISSGWNSFASSVGSAASGLWDSISQGAQGLWDALTGGSIWTDMLDEMLEQAHDRLGKTEKEFKEFNPAIEAGIGQLHSAVSNITPAVTPLVGSAPSLTIHISGNTFSSDIDVKRAVKEAGEEVVRELMSTGRWLVR